MLFTIILEFEGTNSVSQFSASGPNAAFRKWVQGLENPKNYALTPQQARAVTKALADRGELQRRVNDVLATDDRELAPLHGLKNIWCVIAFAGRKPRSACCSTS